MTEPTQAVVDRIVDGVAVLLVGASEVERHLPAEGLPDGAGPGAVLDVVERDDGTLQVVRSDEEEADARRDHLASRLARLREARDPGRFPRRGQDC